MFMKQKLSPFPTHWIIAIAIMLLTAGIRLWFILSADFPLNDGGLFYSMTRDLIQNNFNLPEFTSYNNDHIPFAYSPLTFYFTGFLHTVTALPLIQFFRFLPWFFSLLTLPFYYLIAQELLPKKRIALISLVVFVLSPRSFQSLILGGGLTRSGGMMFALPAIWLSLKFFRNTNIRYLFGAGILFGLSLISHMEVGVFTATSILVIYFVKDRTLKGLLLTGSIGIIGFIIASPWWTTVLSMHGFGPFMAALQSNPPNAISLTQLALISYTSQPQLQIFLSFAIIGILLLISKKNNLILIWITVILLTITRGAHLFVFIPLSLAAGYGIYRIDRLSRLPHNMSLVVIGFFLLLSFSTAFVHDFTPFDHLPNKEQKAMNWISSNTNPEDVFIVISNRPGWAWFLDPTAEWFPALSERKNIGTVQAYEWLPDFKDRIELNKELKTCNDRNLACLERFAQDNKITFSHIYVSKHTVLEPGWPACCTLLTASIHASYKYRLIFENEDVYIFSKISTL